MLEDNIKVDVEKYNVKMWIGFKWHCIGSDTKDFVRTVLEVWYLKERGIY